MSSLTVHLYICDLHSLKLPLLALGKQKRETTSPAAESVSPGLFKHNFYACQGWIWCKCNVIHGVVPEIYTHPNKEYSKFQRGRGSDCPKPYFWEVANFGGSLLSKLYGSCLKVITTVTEWWWWCDVLWRIRFMLLVITTSNFRFYISRILPG